MFRSSPQLRCLSLLATVVACSAGAADPQLRGSEATAAAEVPAQGGLAGWGQPQHTDCGCPTVGACECLRSDASAADTEEQRQLELSLLNHTQALGAWWKQQSEAAQQMQCSCPGGADACQCDRDTGAESSGEVDEALRKETEQLLSLWWVAHGGGYRRGWGYGYGRRCGHVGYGGCGCGYYRGCRCGHVGYTGCR